MVDAALGADNTLEIVELACVRGDHLVFDGLTFTVPPGGIVQLVGANGSGKTSLLRILSGLASPYSGKVRWRGVDIHQHLHTWHQNISVTGHLAGVSFALTARENLEIALALVGNAPRGGIDDALSAVGLAERIDMPAGRLSAGQRQRLALARLALSSAPVWLLDEPLTALDHDGKRLVEQLLDTHTRRGGLAVLATHQSLDPRHLNLRSVELRSVPCS